MAVSLARPHRAAITVMALVALAGLLTAAAAAGGTICDTGSPEPSSSPTSTASPTPTPTVSLPIALSAASRERAGAPSGDAGVGGTCDAAVDLTARPGTGGVWGTTFVLSGGLSCNGLALGSREVELKKYSGGAWQTVSTAPTSEEGYSFTQKPAHSTAYKVVFAGDDLCKAASSAPLTVIVRPGVAMNVASGGSSARGGTAVFSGSVLPAHPGHSVILQVLQGGAWRNAASARLDSASRYRLTYTRRSGSGPLLFRVAYPTQHADHGWNISRNVKVTWT